jgi:iron complex outermembrane recepter protein
MKTLNGFYVSLIVYAVIFSTNILTTQVFAQQSLALEEIVVTAQRREQSLQEVPISIEAIGGQELQQQGYRTLDELADFSPSIELDVRMQDQNISIRGVGTAGSSLALEQAAPTFVDGVVIGRTSMVKSAFFDLERIEVLRGPQPVFFGQNAVAGAFSLISRKPTPEWQGNISLEAGNFGRRTVEGGVGGPITDTLGVRVAGKYDETHGYLIDVITDENFPHRRDRAGRISFQWTPTDSFTATAKHEYTKTSAGSEATVVCLGRFKDAAVADLPDRDGGVALDVDALVTGRTSFDSLQHDVPDCGSGNSPYTRLGLKSATLAFDPPPDVSDEDTRGTGMLNIRDLALSLGPEEYSGKFDEQKWYQGVLDLAYTLQNGIVLNSLTGYVDYYRAGVETSNDAPFFSSVRMRDEDLKQISQEFRVTSPLGGQIEWMVGGYWQKDNLKMFMDNFSANLRRPRRLNRGWQDSRWLSVFATMTFHFLDDRASIDVGGRYSDVDKEVFLNGFGARYVYADEPTGTCAALPECEAVVTTDGQPGYTLEWRTRDMPPNWISPVEPIGITALDGQIRRNPGPLSDTLSQSEFDPQVTLRYRPSDDISLYAKYATAFKAGGYDTGVASLPEDINDRFSFGPEQGETYEIGMKGSLWENRARYEAALFNMEISDLQLATIVTDIGNTGATNVAEALNAGKQRVRGFEFSFDAKLTENLRGRFVGAIMDGKMVKYEGAGCTAAEFAIADTGPCVSEAESAALIADGNLVDDNGDPLDDDTFAGTIDRTGAPAPRTPDWKFALKLDYEKPFMNNYMIYANSNFVASDGYITNVEEFDLVQKVGSHYDMNISGGIGDAGDRWRLTAYARNLFGVQEEYNPEFDTNGDGILFDDAGQSWYTSYGLLFQYNYN